MKQFEFNKMGVCNNPNVLSKDYGGVVHWRIKTCYVEGFGWCYGYDVNTANPYSGVPCSTLYEPEGMTEEQAVMEVAEHVLLFLDQNKRGLAGESEHTIGYHPKKMYEDVKRLAKPTLFANG